MAKCAYLSGTNKWSEWEGCWKEAHSDPDRVRLIEVMLPPNAPREYADPQTLWNAVDAAEKDSQAQTARVIEMSLPRELTYEQNLALVREYCQQQFVDKGMCCNFYYHDSGNGNPHVHIMLTITFTSCASVRRTAQFFSLISITSPLGRSLLVFYVFAGGRLRLFEFLAQRRAFPLFHFLTSQPDEAIQHSRMRRNRILITAVKATG